MRRHHAAIVGLLVIMASVACVGSSSLSQSTLGGPVPPSGVSPLPVGGRVSLGCDGFWNHGREPLRVRSAALLDASPHLHVISIQAVDRRQHGTILATRELAGFDLGPATNVVFPPDKDGKEQAGDWYLDITLSADAPGTFTAQRIRVTVTDPAGGTLTEAFPWKVTLIAR